MTAKDICKSIESAFIKQGYSKLGDMHKTYNEMRIMTGDKPVSYESFRQNIRGITSTKLEFVVLCCRILNIDLKDLLS